MTLSPLRGTPTRIVRPSACVSSFSSLFSLLFSLLVLISDQSMSPLHQTPDSFDPSPLIGYLKTLQIPYFYESQQIMERAKGSEEVSSICSYCARMKRGIIYSCARREGYNVLAMGQHLDDLCESFLMSIFHNGMMRTMKAHYTNKSASLSPLS